MDGHVRIDNSIYPASYAAKRGDHRLMLALGFRHSLNTPPPGKA
jgi:hypothetical protein